MAHPVSIYRDVVTLLKLWEKHGKHKTSSLLALLSGLDQPYLVAALEAILAHGHRNIRFTVVSALPYIAADRVVDLLIPHVRDSDAVFRWTLCQVFQFYNDERVVPLLASALIEDPEPDVRLVAAETLWDIGDKRALNALDYAASHDTGHDYEGRSIANTARKAIAAIHARQPQNN